MNLKIHLKMYVFSAQRVHFMFTLLQCRAQVYYAR